MSASIDTLAAKADKARAAYEAAERAAENARAEAEQQRAGRLAEYDRQLVEQYDEAELADRVRQAERDLEEAVAGSTLGRAWVALKVAQLQAAHLTQHAASAAQRVGAGAGYSSPVANNAAFEELGRAVDRAAARDIADELDALDAAREQAGQG